MSVLERLDAIYEIAQHRAGYSPEENAAHELAAGWMREAGLEVSVDEAGTLFGTRGEARVWTGSHLDSVPTGGRFDGALGVVAAIEAAARLPAAPLAVVAFRAEETGPMSSRRLTELPDAFLEVHIEQGPVLALADEPLGVVTAIAGQARGVKVFEGRADHAGTTPMDARQDALVAAARFVLHVRDSARAALSRMPCNWYRIFDPAFSAASINVLSSFSSGPWISARAFSTCSAARSKHFSMLSGSARLPTSSRVFSGVLNRSGRESW